MTDKDRFEDAFSAYPDIISTKQLQDICGICKTKVYFLKRDGLIQYEKKLDRLTHYHEIRLEDVLAFLRKKEHEENAFRACIEQFYAAEIEKYSDVLTTDCIMEITGYGKTSVNNWILHKKLKSLKRGRKSFIPRIYLMEFLTSATYASIQVKSPKHKATINAINAMINSSVQMKKIQEDTYDS